MVLLERNPRQENGAQLRLPLHNMGKPCEIPLSGSPNSNATASAKLRTFSKLLLIVSRRE
jgi:hypothetical protein